MIFKAAHPHAGISKPTPIMKPMRSDGYSRRVFECVTTALLLILAMSLFGAREESIPAGRAATDDATSQPSSIAPPSGPIATPAGPLSNLIRSGSKVAILRVEGLIYDFTLESLKRRVDRAVAGGATVIVFEIDSYGGVVTSALDISKYIKTIPVPTIAWINPKAYSAGILFASSCNAIVMSSSAAAGDCAPIVPGQNLSPTERAKALSPILAEFRDNAVHGNYDYTVFHAMCELGVQLYEVEHKTTGERRIVNQADYEVMVRGTTPDQFRGTGINPLLSTSTAPPPPPPVPAPGNTASQPAQVPTPGVPDSAAALGDAGTRTEENFNHDDQGGWTLVRQIHDGRSLLTLSQGEATALGISRGVVQNEQDLQNLLSASSVTRIDLYWVEGAAYWLTRPWMRAILVSIVLLGAYFEVHSPGFGIGGIAAGIALLLLIVSPYLIGLAAVWHLILFGIGLLLLLVEIFLIPGFGVVGIVGIVMMFVGLVLAIVPTSGSNPLSLPPPEMWKQLQLSLIWMLVAVLFSGVGFFYITKYFGHLPLVDRIVLTHRPGTGGAVARELPVGGDEVIGFGKIVVGNSGRALSQLRPSGRADIDGQIIDVVTPGVWIEPGAPIKVVEVAGNRIVVERM